MPPKLHQIQNIVAHEGKINSMILGHRTSQIFATGGEDRFLRLWSVGNNNPRSSFGPFQSPITACRFNSTEEMIVCANNSGTVMLFDLNENLCSSNWTSHHSTVRCLSFHSHDPRLILSCGIDGKFNVLSTTQRIPIQSYNAHDGPANYVTCSPDGKYAATCGEDKTIRVFDLTAQKQLIKFEGHSGSINCIEFHPNLPLLISCADDRSVKFWDMENQSEITSSLPLDSSPVDLVTFVPYPNQTTYDASISASSDYIKVLGWKPPQLYDHFTLGLDRVHDIAIDNNSVSDSALTIAASSNDQAVIYRILLNQLKPFSALKPTAQFDIPSEKEKQKSSTPRLLDLAAMTKVKPQKRAKGGIAASSSVGSNFDSNSKTKSASNPSSKTSSKVSSRSSNRSVSSGAKNVSARSPNCSSATESDLAEKRSNSSGSRFSKNSDRKRPKPSSYTSDTSEETKIFRDFRKYRGSFITQMNERYARLTRVKDFLAMDGLTKTLEFAAESGELGNEMLAILGMRPEVVKLEHAALMMQIAVKVFDRDYDLAISTVESMLQAFGKLVNVTRQTSLNGVGCDTALEERKKKSDAFVEAFREIAPKMRTVACGKSQISQTAAEILDQWKFFLR